MKLQPHKTLIKDGKKNKGYAIRIGRHLPKNSANLAYVSSKAVTPEENILLQDVSSLITENGLAGFVETDYVVYPSEDYLLETESGQSLFPTDSVNITDEFTLKKNRQDTPQPVFFRMELAGRFDARTAQVIPYQGGYSTETEQDAVSLQSITPDKRNELLYVGDSIRIEANGTDLPSDKIYKVQLVRESNFLYRVIVMTNFRNGDDITYKVIYPSYNTKTESSELKEEVLNAYPFFEQVTNDQFDEIVKQLEQNPDQQTYAKVYTVVEKNNNYEFYATSDVIVANYETRQPQMFKHRVEAKLSTKLSETNPGKINIGFYHISEAVGVENLKSIGKALGEHSLLPNYLELNNPHPTRPDYLKRDINYWSIDLDMPEYHYEDYDLIVITGYGAADLSMYQDKLEYYLNNGGTVWVDNAGSVATVLQLKSFVADISFSKTTEHAVKQLDQTSPYVSRLYAIKNNQELGYTGVSPSIVFGVDEERSQWDEIATHLNGGPSIIKRSFNERGTILISNCGIFRGFYHNQTENVNFVLNAILYHAEEKWVFTPWRNDFVYHRDNLFAQEYKVNNSDMYINDRNDYNPNEIVAKKMMYSSCRDYVKIYADKWFTNATGTYLHVIDGDNKIDVANSQFESGHVDESGQMQTEWTANTESAIPGWNTRKMAGGDVTYRYTTEGSLFGVRHISLESSNGSSGAQAFWESETHYLSADDYKVSVWSKTENVRGITTDGVKIGVYKITGEPIATSVALSGTKGQTMLELSFTIDEPQYVQFRLGFVDGNGYGKAHFDELELYTVGAVKGVAKNEGEKALYAFSTKPNPTTVDIQAGGFEQANVTIASPEVPFTFTILPFVYKWHSYGFSEQTGDELGRYERAYGTPVAYKSNIRKSDGLVNLGHLHALLPATPSGNQWSDRNNIYYKIGLGAESDMRNNLINLKLFDRKSGTEWYYNNELIIGYKDIYWATDEPTFILHAETDYETVRASKRNFGLQLKDDQRIFTELPQTKDAKENWYLRIHNGRFLKDSLGYQEWAELHESQNQEVIDTYKERVMRKEVYEIKEYDSQIFNPSVGIMEVENEMEYLSPKMVKVPHNNLHIQQGYVEMEELTPQGIAGSYNLMPHNYDSFNGLDLGPAARVATQNTQAIIQEEKAMYGNQSLEVSGTATNKVIYFDQPQGSDEKQMIPVYAGGGYIFSFYVQAVEDVSIAALAEFKSGEVVQSEFKSIKSGNEWTRVELFFLAPIGADSVSIGIKTNGAGAFYVDCMQLEIPEDYDQELT